MPTSQLRLTASHRAHLILLQTHCYQQSKIATTIRAANDLRRQEEEARRQVADKVRHHKLEMKVSDTEWQWDRAKLTIFFTAEKRVDFRALVRDLAGMFRARIELRQIGVRDEAARLGGVGRCVSLAQRGGW